MKILWRSSACGSLSYRNEQDVNAPVRMTLTDALNAAAKGLEPFEPESEYIRPYVVYDAVVVQTAEPHLDSMLDSMLDWAREALPDCEEYWDGEQGPSIPDNEDVRASDEMIALRVAWQRFVSAHCKIEPALTRVVPTGTKIRVFRDRSWSTV
jgi:hypothetical protein